MPTNRATLSAGERVVKCPACNGPAVYAQSNRWRPFCSEHCRQADLGAWASERYRVPSAAPVDTSTDGPPDTAH